VIGTDLHHNQAYMIDFGLARKYRDIRTHVHIPFLENYSTLTGTSAFASLNSHRGVEQSRRDDLESLAYVLIYFLCGSLPWYRAKISTEAQRNKIIQMKVNSTADLLNGSPIEFSVFLDYTRTLNFEDKPDYAYLRKLFHDLRVREGHHHNNIFDWCLPSRRPDDQGHQTPSSGTRPDMKAVLKENGKGGISYSDRV
jgi:casein kinase I homolog HRR25